MDVLNPDEYDVLSVLGQGSFGRALKCRPTPWYTWIRAVPAQVEIFVVKEVWLNGSVHPMYFKRYQLRFYGVRVCALQIYGTNPGDEEEAKLLRGCNHKNIVQYFASAKWARSLHIAME